MQDKRPPGNLRDLEYSEATCNQFATFQITWHWPALVTEERSHKKIPSPKGNRLAQKDEDSLLEASVLDLSFNFHERDVIDQSVSCHKLMKESLCAYKILTNGP